MTMRTKRSKRSVPKSKKRKAHKRARPIPTGPFFTSFFSLLDQPGQWGREFPTKQEQKDFMKSPELDALQMGVLCRILSVLVEIREELRKPKTIQ